MIKQKFDINNLRPASPCSMSWENMSGDERTRFCASCKLSVYNVSEMTTSEVRALFIKTGGNFCGRIYRRADGTVLTKDCPVGLRAFYKRTARFAGAALTAIVSLFSVGFGQKDSKKDKACKVTSQFKIPETETKKGTSIVEGTLTDPNGAVIPGTVVILKNEQTNKGFTTTTNDEGYYLFSEVPSGNYILHFERSGFKTSQARVVIKEDDKRDISLKMEAAAGGTVVVGGPMYDPNYTIDMSSSSVTYTITRDMFRF
jgi:hypothetical protein